MLICLFGVCNLGQAKLSGVRKFEVSNVLSVSWYIYLFSVVVDFSSEKYRNDYLFSQHQPLVFTNIG